MKRFARVLQELLTEHELNQTALADLSGIDRLKIHRLLNSITRASSEDLAGLFGAFTDPRERFRLTLAHIQDELPDEAFKHLDIQPQVHHLRDAPAAIPNNLSPRVERALRFLLSELEAIPSIADVIVDLARALGWEEKPVEPVRGKVKYPAPKKQAGGKPIKSSPARLSEEERL